MVDCSLWAARYPPSFSFHPLCRTVGGRKQDVKCLRLNERQRDHLPIAVRCKTDLGKIIWIYCQLKTELDGEKKNIRTKTLSLILLLFHRLSLTASFPTPLSPPCYEWHRRMRNGLLISPCEFHSAAASSSQFFLNQYLVSAWSAALPEQILCGISGWVAVPQDKPFSALVLPRLQFLQDMATCSGMEPSTSCRVDKCSIPVPSMGCRGNFCCGACSAFPPSSLTSVLQDYLSHFCFPHSVPCTEFCFPSPSVFIAEHSAVPRQILH